MKINRRLLWSVGLLCSLIGAGVLLFSTDSPEGPKKEVIEKETVKGKTVPAEVPAGGEVAANAAPADVPTKSEAEKMKEGAAHLEEWAKKYAVFFKPKEPELSEPEVEPWPMDSEPTDPYDGPVSSGESKNPKADENANGLWDRAELIIIGSVGADRRTTEALFASLLHKQEAAENGIFWTDEQKDRYMENTSKLVVCERIAWNNSPFRGDGLNIIMKKVDNVVYGTPQGKASNEALKDYFDGKSLSFPDMSDEECQALLQEMGIAR